MTARRVFHCRPCKRGDCTDCVRLVWRGEGCVHECGAGRQLSLFPLHQAVPEEGLVPARPAEVYDDVDW